MFPSISRRQVLRLAGSTLTAGAAGLFGRLGLTNAYAQGSDYKALVCVFLFGGNDSNNMVIPSATTKNSYLDYSSIRKAVAIPQASLLPISTGRDTYGLHPAMTDIHTLYQNGRAAVVANLGPLAQPLSKAQYLGKQGVIPSNLFSHDDQQAQWQTLDPTGNAATGWAGRVADLLGPVYNVPAAGSATPFPAALSLAGDNILEKGNSSAPAMATSSGVTKLSNWPATPNARTKAFTNLLAFDNGVKLVTGANDILESGINDSKTLDAALTASTFNPTFPTTTLGTQLKMVARIINVHPALGASRQIFFVSLGGFDNHDKLLTDQDSNLGQVSAALGAFYAALDSVGLGRNVTSFLESDFSRTNQPNTNEGSDHAWGSHQIVMGSAVQAGLYGTFPTLALGGIDDVTGRGVYLPTTSVDQYGATLARWFGVTDADLPSIFPNLNHFAATNLGFLG